MSGDVHVRFCESPRGKFSWATRHIICVRYVADAEAILAQLKERLRKFGLELAEEKTKLVRFGKFAKEKARKQRKKAGTFDFLGFTHYNDTDRNGVFKVGRKTARKKYVTKLKEIYVWLKSVRTIRPKDWWQILCAKLRGHFQYYGVSGNYRSINRFYETTLRYLYKWLNRRSQKKSFNWDGFQDYLSRFALPKPRIYHNLYVNRSYRGEC